MRFKLSLLFVFPAISIAGFFACSSPTANSGSSFTLANTPATIHVGDAVITAPATEKSVDELGRTNTTSTSVYTLVSNNPHVLGISGVKIIGVDTGTTGYSAMAGDGTGLTSATYSITVLAKATP